MDIRTILAIVLVLLSSARAHGFTCGEGGNNGAWQGAAANKLSPRSTRGITVLQRIPDYCCSVNRKS